MVLKPARMTGLFGDGGEKKKKETSDHVGSRFQEELDDPPDFLPSNEKV